METLFIPNKDDFKRWIKEAVSECLQDCVNNNITNEQQDDTLLNRKEVANLLRISLVTLTDWIDRGLPSHKPRGRVYFIKSEVLNYIKENKMRQLKFSPKYQKLNRQ